MKGMNIKMIEKLKEALKDEEVKKKFIESVKPELKDEALTDDFLARIGGGNGRWFLPDDTTVGVCDECKTYSFMNCITGERCEKCGKEYTRIIYAKDLPDDYDMNL